MQFSILALFKIMNIHVPAEIQNKYRCFNFKGKRFNYKGRTMIRAIHKTLESTFYYSFEEDFAWLMSGDINSVPDWFMVKM